MTYILILTVLEIGQAEFFREHRLSKFTYGIPVLVFAICNGGNSLHQLISQLIKDRLVKLQARGAMEVQEGQSRLESWQQDSIFCLQPDTQGTKTEWGLVDL